MDNNDSMTKKYQHLVNNSSAHRIQKRYTKRYARYDSYQPNEINNSVNNVNDGIRRDDIPTVAHVNQNVIIGLKDLLGASSSESHSGLNDVFGISGGKQHKTKTTSNIGLNSMLGAGGSKQQRNKKQSGLFDLF